MEITQQIIGAKLDVIVRLCDLIKFDFVKENQTFCLHVQSALTRGRSNERIIFCSNDMFVPGSKYQKRRFKKFKWDEPGMSLFDDEIVDFCENSCNVVVQKILVKEDDLAIVLSNGFTIEIFKNTLERDHEIYRLFKKGDLESHFVVET